MAKDLSRDELRHFARLGAQRRLEELKREEAAIRAAFPDLGGTRAGGAKGRRKGRAAAGDGAAPAAKRPARYRMSAAQKRAVSERMRKYWAARRKAKG